MLRGDLRFKLASWGEMLGAKYADWERGPFPDTLFPLYYLPKPLMWCFSWYLPGTKNPEESGKSGAAPSQPTC